MGTTQGIDATDFNCRCMGTGKIAMKYGKYEKEAKCDECEQWRHQQNAEKMPTYQELKKKKWREIT